MKAISLTFLFASTAAFAQHGHWTAHGEISYQPELQTSQVHLSVSGAAAAALHQSMEENSDIFCPGPTSCHLTIDSSGAVNAGPQQLASPLRFLPGATARSSPVADSGSTHWIHIASDEYPGRDPDLSAMIWRLIEKGAARETSIEYGRTIETVIGREIACSRAPMNSRRAFHIWCRILFTRHAAIDLLKDMKR